MCSVDQDTKVTGMLTMRDVFTDIAQTSNTPAKNFNLKAGPYQIQLGNIRDLKNGLPGLVMKEVRVWGSPRTTD
jgi:hypothetical protein